jgi:hypothetical protein
MIKKIRVTIVLILTACCFYLMAPAQVETDIEPYNTLSFFYIDNSEGSKTEGLNIEMQNKIKERLTETLSKHDNYFLAFTANGDKGKVSANLLTFIDNGIKKYLQKSSNEPDYSSEKQAIREFFNDYPVRIKQSVELNFFLSANSINYLLNEASSLPTPVLIPQELVLYLNSNQVKMKVNYYSNKEIITEQLTEEKLKETFEFCSQELKLNRLTYSFTFL